MVQHHLTQPVSRTIALRGQQRRQSSVQMPQSLPLGQQTSPRGQTSGDHYIIAGQRHNSHDSEEDDEEEDENTSEEEDSDNGDDDSRSRRVTTAPTMNDRYFAASPRSYTFPAANTTQAAPQTHPRQITAALAGGGETVQNAYQQMQRPIASSSKASESAYGRKSEDPLGTGLVFELNMTFGTNSAYSCRFVLVESWNRYLVALPLTNCGAQPARSVDRSYIRPAVAYAPVDGRARQNGNDNRLVVLLDSRAAKEPQNLTINFGEPYYIDPATKRWRLGVVQDVSSLKDAFRASQTCRFSLEYRQRGLTQSGQVAVAPSKSSRVDHPCLKPIFFHVDFRKAAFPDAVALYDSGSTCDVVGPSTVQKLGLRPTPLRKSRSIEFANGTRTLVSSLVEMNFSLEPDGKIHKRDFYLLPSVDSLGWQAILGAHTLSELGKLGFGVARPDTERLIVNVQYWLKQDTPEEKIDTERREREARAEDAKREQERDARERERLRKTRDSNGKRRDDSSPNNSP